MHRRSFLKLSTLSTVALALPSCSLFRTERNFDVRVISNSAVGHLIREAHTFPVHKKIKKEALIVGAGMSGLAAALQFKDKDVVVCELDETNGGTSSCFGYKENVFGQGAHYDLSYPNYFGKETLHLLQDLDIVAYNSLSEKWEFNDKQYIIPDAIESNTYYYGDFKEELLEENDLKKKFLEVLEPYVGKMTLPTRLIDQKYHELNTLTFAEFLKDKITLTKEFVDAVDYQIKDDFGGGSKQVSALAGIHYYRCRPYYSNNVELFSPPEGNYYFIKKMMDALPEGSVLNQHLVYAIEENKDGFLSKVIDVATKSITEIQSKQVVYAGKKQSLPYVFPKDGQLFKDNSYAPWVVMNIVLNDRVSDEVYWQNEILSKDKRFLGFIDSLSQKSKNKNQVLTAYYCFDPGDRSALLEIEQNPQPFVKETIEQISAYFDTDISDYVEKVFVKLMGHAMAIPKPGFLFNDQNQYRSSQNLVYAGVDNARLPLLFEALDSGITAAQLLRTDTPSN